MTAEFHDDLLWLVWTPPWGSDHAAYIRRRLEAGEEIPDRLLPGRAIMMRSKQYRAKLECLTSSQVANVSPWWIHIMCGKAGIPADIEKAMLAIERGYKRQKDALTLISQ